MKIFLRDQDEKLTSYLEESRTINLSYTDTHGLPERTIKSRIPDDTRNLETSDLGFLFRYEVFPPTILKFHGEWQLAGREMRVGDVIVQQAQVPPGWGVRLVFGVRVLSVYREETRAGFSYGTLAGHPETGTNEFSFSVIGGGILAAVKTVAAPALPLTRLLAPIFTHRYIAFCNRQALQRMEEKFLQANSAVDRSAGVS